MRNCKRCGGPLDDNGECQNRRPSIDMREIHQLPLSKRIVELEAALAAAETERDSAFDRGQMQQLEICTQYLQEERAKWEDELAEARLRGTE